MNKTQISKPANKEIRIFDKKTRKVKVVSLYTSLEIEQIKEKIIRDIEKW